MKVTITPYDRYYTGLMMNPSQTALVLGKKITEKGMLWWKEVEEEDVWCIVSSKGYSMCSVTCSTDYFWGVVRYFPYNRKATALKFYEDLGGDL